jgi:hypothetical protein
MEEGCESKDDGIPEKVNEMIEKNSEARTKRRKPIPQIRPG